MSPTNSGELSYISITIIVFDSLPYVLLAFLFLYYTFPDPGISFSLLSPSLIILLPCFNHVVNR